MNLIQLVLIYKRELPQEIEKLSMPVWIPLSGLYINIVLFGTCCLPNTALLYKASISFSCRQLLGRGMSMGIQFDMLDYRFQKIKIPPILKTYDKSFHLTNKFP